MSSLTNILSQMTSKIKVQFDITPYSIPSYSALHFKTSHLAKQYGIKFEGHLKMKGHLY